MCETLWEGRIHVDELSWTYRFQGVEEAFGHPLDPLQTDEIWVEYSSTHDVYDGELLGVVDFHDRTFECFSYPFRQHIALVRAGVNLSGFRGNLGFKLHVFSPGKDSVLIGRRSRRSDYMAGFLSSVGGMFELGDLTPGVAAAVLRELEEEAGIRRGDLSWDTFQLISIMREENGIAVDLVLEVELLRDVEPVPNEEWDSLYWTPREEQVPGGAVMSHLRYCL